MKLIDKDVLVAEIDKFLDNSEYHESYYCGYRDGNNDTLDALKEKIDTLEVKDLYEQCVQYDSIKTGIQAHAETYSFNIESELFNQLTKEQQTLWRKEIEQACISGGDAGYSLARDIRYKENLKVKEVDLEKEISIWWNNFYSGLEKDYPFEGYSGHYIENSTVIALVKHFFELGLKTQKEE